MSKRVFYAVIALLALTRYWLCADTEVVGARWDTEGLATLALNGYWSDMGSLYRPPVLPVVAHWITAIGLPYRMFLEIALVGASAFLAAQLRPRANGFLAIAVFGVLVFNAYSIRSFTEFQREPFLYIEYIALVGFSMIVFDANESSARRTVASLLFGLCAAGIVLTREGEEIFIAALIAVQVVASLVWRSPNDNWLATIRLLVVQPCAIVIALCALTGYLHNLEWGAPSYRGMLPSLQGFLTQIHRIKVDDSSQYAPATRQSFAAAARVSKTVAEFAGPMAASDAEATWEIDTVRHHSLSFVHRLEIDPSRTFWVIDSLLRQKYGWNPRLLIGKLHTATDELRAAFDSGALPRTALSLPYPLDPNLGAWLPSLPAEMGHVLHALIVPSADEVGYRPPDDFRPDLFDAALTRRGHLVAEQFKTWKDGVREALVGNYRYLIGTLAALSLIIGAWRPIGGRAWPLTLTLLVLLGARFPVYSVMLASVAPVDRYVVFLSPLAGALICLLCAFAGYGLRSLFAARPAGVTGVADDFGPGAWLTP